MKTMATAGREMSRSRSKDAGIETLSGVDGAFLNLETEATPMHVGSLHLFESPPGYRGDFHKSVRHMMQSRMVPVLQRRLAALPLQLANPVWVQDAVDYDYHIRRIKLPRPGTWGQLEATVADLHAQLLDRSRPLWMLYVLEGLASGEKAYYFKVHHAMLDGQAGVALAGALFSTSPEPLPPARRGARKKAVAPEQPGTLALAAAAFRHDAAQYVKLVRELPGVLRTLAGIVKGSAAKASGAAHAGEAASLAELKRSASFGPRTVFNVAITPERGFATATIPRAELKAIAAALDATVNDVVMTLASGALRRWLKRNSSVPRKPLIASMPISLREQGNTEMRTQATLSLVNLASHIADPVKRLQAIRDSSGATKAVARQAKSVIPTDIPLLGVPWLLGRPGKPLRPQQRGRYAADPGQRADLQCAGAARAAICRWPAHDRLLAAVHRRAWRRREHHAAELFRKPLLRLRRGEERRARGRRTGRGFHGGACRAQKRRVTSADSCNGADATQARGDLTMPNRRPVVRHGHVGRPHALHSLARTARAAGNGAAAGLAAAAGRGAAR
jgi:diacylglycerol O-acyltransferase